MPMNNSIIVESDYFHPIETIVKNESVAVVVYDRVSGRIQKENRETRKQLILKTCKVHGLNVIKYFAESVNGMSTSLNERKVFPKAVQFAKDNDAIIVAPAVNRILRTDGNKDAPLMKADMKRLETFLRGLDCENVKFFTLISPNTPADRVSGELKKLGQKAKDNSGGRPRDLSCANKDELLPIVKKMYEQKKSYRKVSDTMLRKYNKSISKTTVGVWLNQDKNQFSKTDTADFFDE